MVLIFILRKRSVNNWGGVFPPVTKQSASMILGGRTPPLRQCKVSQPRASYPLSLVFMGIIIQENDTASPLLCYDAYTYFSDDIQS